MDETDFKDCNTPEDYASILEQFLELVKVKVEKEKAENVENGIWHCVMECNKKGEIIPSLKVPVTSKAYEIIKTLREDYNIEFQLLACTKGNDGSELYINSRKITEPTTLGFEVYDCLENINIYFFGKGYRTYVDDVPYTQGGKISVMVHAESRKQIASFDGEKRMEIRLGISRKRDWCHLI